MHTYDAIVIGAGQGGLSASYHLKRLGIDHVVLDGDETAEYALVSREELMAGDVLEGPVVVTEHTATTVLHAGDRLEVGAYGELIISIQYAKKGA